MAMRSALTKSILSSAALAAALALAGAQGAYAFTYENGGSSSPSGQADPKANFGGNTGSVDVDASSLMPPIGTSVPGMEFNSGPGAFNNGMAMQPTRNDSVGPSWLYPPR
jgi:hypothetical protein